MISFPFARGRLYPFRELRLFECALSSARQVDIELSKELRVPTGASPPWMRLRNKELVPLRWLGEHMGASDSDLFELSDVGDPVDAKLIVGGQRFDVQLTLAAPHWRGSGYRHHQILSALNQSDCVIGYAPYVIEDKIAIGEVDVVSSEDRELACREGLAAALAKKSLFDGKGIVLAVFVQEFFYPTFRRAFIGEDG